MFKNTYPLFERKKVLKKEMLENLRDYPRDVFHILYRSLMCVWNRESCTITKNFIL